MIKIKRKRKLREPRYTHVGPGGIGCACCFPRPGSQGRKLEFRKAKRRQAKADLMCELVPNSHEPKD